MLIGEIPDRNIFENELMKKQLRPYYKIVQAVRSGDINKFNTTLDNAIFKRIFIKDGNCHLV